MALHVTVLRVVCVVCAVCTRVTLCVRYDIHGIQVAYKSPWSLFLQGLAQAHPKISEGGGSAQWAKVNSVKHIYIHMRRWFFLCMIICS